MAVECTNRIYYTPASTAFGVVWGVVRHSAASETANTFEHPKRNNTTLERSKHAPRLC
jgi:hypothetical protein